MEDWRPGGARKPGRLASLPASKLTPLPTSLSTVLVCGVPLEAFDKNASTVLANTTSDGLANNTADNLSHWRLSQALAA